MARIESLKPLFVNQQVAVGWAILWTIAAVAVPTFIRQSLQGIVSGCETVTFVPFVVVSAIFLGWRYATIVALTSAFFADALFLVHGHKLLEGPCDIYGTSVFLFGSAIIIGSIEIIRRELRKLPDTDGAQKRAGGVVFSLEDGQAFASWYGKSTPVRLGPERDVAEMMEDFLAQIELARRLGGDK
jgi:hypothetical protein